MTRWLIAYDDNVVTSDDPQTAAEMHAEQMQLSFGATVYAVDIDAIAGTDRCVRLRIGAHEIPEETTP